MTTRALLIYPRPSVSSPQHSPPLSILHVGRALSEAKQRGKSDEDYEVEYFDERYDNSPDLSWPDVVGVSSMTGYQLKGAIKWLKAAKAAGKRTVLGGIHVTMQPESCIDESFVDSVVLSEGEWGIIEAIHGGPKQIVKSRLTGTQDHVSPVSPETLIHFKRSARTGDTVLMTSRGCPFRCGFAVHRNSQIPTAHSPEYKFAENIRAGEWIVGWDEKKACFNPTKVVEVQFVKPELEIVIGLRDTKSLMCSLEHPIFTKSGWREAQYIVVGQHVMTHSHAGWQEVTFTGIRMCRDFHVNIQCDPLPTFVADGIATHNCYIQEFFNRTWQSVDLDRWKHDVLYLKENACVKKYEHGDDWIGKWPRAREIIKFLWDNEIEYRPSIRAHQINDEVAREMADMGIKHISVGMETASERMLKLSQKDITKGDQIQCAEALAKYGIHPLFYWIVFMPTETREELNETLDVSDQIARIFKSHNTPLTQNYYSYLPLPGSPMFDLVDKETLPKTMEGWSEYSLNQGPIDEANAIYFIGGLHFHRAKGDKTDRNFPGWKRLLIYPFEILASLRWKYRKFGYYKLEKWAIERLLKWASRRYERRTTGQRVKGADIMDWGVRENDIGARGEFLTGEIDSKHSPERIN